MSMHRGNTIGREYSIFFLEMESVPEIKRGSAGPAIGATDGETDPFLHSLIGKNGPIFCIIDLGKPWMITGARK
jgi:hypothetical protein